MDHHIKMKLFLFISLIICFTGYALAQISPDTPIADYIFETIEVPGVDFLEVAASNDFGDYAGNTRSPDGKKKIGFTLIDGVFTTYDFPRVPEYLFLCTRQHWKSSRTLQRYRWNLPRCYLRKMANSRNTIFPVQLKPTSMVLVMKRGH